MLSVSLQSFPVFSLLHKVFLPHPFSAWRDVRANAAFLSIISSEIASSMCNVVSSTSFPGTRLLLQGSARLELYPKMEFLMVVPPPQGVRNIRCGIQEFPSLFVSLGISFWLPRVGVKQLIAQSTQRQFRGRIFHQRHVQSKCRAPGCKLSLRLLTRMTPFAVCVSK